jgi:hypothetical protein
VTTCASGEIVARDSADLLKKSRFRATSTPPGKRYFSKNVGNPMSKCPNERKKMRKRDRNVEKRGKKLQHPPIPVLRTGRTGAISSIKSKREI